MDNFWPESDYGKYKKEIQNKELLDFLIKEALTIEGANLTEEDLKLIKENRAKGIKEREEFIKNDKP